MLSIIIPIFNAEKYLEKCIDSILEQRYTEYELILVDDGSIDKSAQMCDEYADKDNRVIVIHKENGGLSDARNTGVKVTKGEYIFFIDSDDFLDDNKALEKIVNRLKKSNADVLNFGFKKYYANEDKEYNYFKIDKNMPIEYCKDEKGFEFLMQNSLYIASAWNKVIRRQLFEKSDLSFKKGIYSEDIDWCARLLIVAKKFDFINESFYCYRQREGSISKSISNKNLKDLKDAIVICYDMSKDLQGDFKNDYLSYVAYQYATFLVCQAKVKLNQENKTYIDQMRKYSFLLKYSNNKKVRILYILHRVLEYKNLCRLIRIFYRVK